MRTTTSALPDRTPYMQTSADERGGRGGSEIRSLGARGKPELFTATVVLKDVHVGYVYILSRLPYELLASCIYLSSWWQQ